MLHKTQGIVISFVKFRETSIICKIFTENFGLQSYIVNGVRKQSKTNTIALYQPLTLLDLVVYHNHSSEIHRIKEVKNAFPFQSIYTSPPKILISSFITELINKTVKVGFSSSDLFEFLKYSVTELDSTYSKLQYFSLIFLLEYADLLGFKPVSAFEIMNTTNNLGKYGRDSPQWQMIDSMIEKGFGFDCISSIDERRAILDLMLNFYQSNIENLGELKSIKILRELCEV